MLWDAEPKDHQGGNGSLGQTLVIALWRSAKGCRACIFTNLSALGMGDLERLVNGWLVHVRTIHLFLEHFSIQLDLLLCPVDET